MLVNTGSPLCILGDIVTGFDILLCKDSKIIGGCRCEELLKNDAWASFIFLFWYEHEPSLIYNEETRSFSEMELRSIGNRLFRNNKFNTRLTYEQILEHTIEDYEIEMYEDRSF